MPHCKHDTYPSTLYPLTWAGVECLGVAENWAEPLIFLLFDKAILIMAVANRSLQFGLILESGAWNNVL